MRSRFVLWVFAWLMCLTNLPAGAPAPDEFSTKAAQLNGRYNAEDWPGTLALIDDLLRLAAGDAEPDRRAELLFVKARVLARAGDVAKAIASARAAIAAGRNGYMEYAGEADFRALRDAPDFRAMLRDLKAKNGPRPLEWDAEAPGPDFSVRFDGPDVPELETLRNEFSVGLVVEGARDDYERLKRLTEWTSRQWKHSSTQSASKADPLTILREARKGGRFICMNYGVVLRGVANAYGLRARLIGMLPADVETRSEAHTAVEVWLPQFRKWVLADAQWGIIAESGGVPLSAAELQRSIATEEPMRCVPFGAPCDEWKRFIYPNLYYFKIGDDQRSYGGHTSRQLVLMPKGASTPRKFAGGSEWVFKDAVYASSLAAFYRAPD